MSTSWVRTMNAVIPDEEILEETDSRKTLINEISKIQMPQNATKMQINESLLRNSNLTERKIPDESGRTKKPRSIPPPLFHSSAVSNDVFQSDEGITMPSSIRKIVECTQNDSDEDEPIGRAQDIDDYIARGASQLNFSKTLESLSTSLKQTTPCGSTFSHERSHKGLKTSKKVTPSLNVSKKAVEVIEETPTKWNRSIHQEEKNKTASSSKSKSEPTLEISRIFDFSRKLHSPAKQPVPVQCEKEEERRHLTTNVRLWCWHAENVRRSFQQRGSHRRSRSSAEEEKGKVLVLNSI